MSTDVESVVLSLLSRGPSLPGHPDIEAGQSSRELSINGVRYDLISSTVDILLRHPSSSLQAARSILAVRKAATESSSVNTEGGIQPVLELAAHTFSSPQDCPDSMPHVPTTIIDTDVLRDGSRPTKAQRASAIPAIPRPATRILRQPALRDIYHAYIATINAGAAAMTSHLAEFCHPMVTHNGQCLSLTRYRKLMEDAQVAIPDMIFRVVDLIVDEEKQQVAARLAFTGTPVKIWEDVKPNGKQVSFSEQVFYWFEDGKICSVVSVVDMEAYRKQMRA